MFVKFSKCFVLVRVSLRSPSKRQSDRHLFMFYVHVRFQRQVTSELKCSRSCPNEVRLYKVTCKRLAGAVPGLSPRHVPADVAADPHSLLYCLTRDRKTYNLPMGTFYKTCPIRLMYTELLQRQMNLRRKQRRSRSPWWASRASTVSLFC